MAEKGKRSNFFKEVKNELKKVVYPTPSAVKNNTIIVIVVVLIVGSFIWILDFGFSAGRKVIIENMPAQEEYIPETEADENIDSEGNIDEGDLLVPEEEPNVVDDITMQGDTVPPEVLDDGSEPAPSSEEGGSADGGE